MTSSIPFKTPLFDSHVKHQARMVEFAGWQMPVQYTGVKDEHLWVRSQVGLFDVSHMGEIRFTGDKALSSLQWLTTNDVAKLNNGEAHYSLLPNQNGGLVDDIIIYCIEKNQNYFVCVNAANKDKDFAWMKANNKGAVITDESSQWGQIAVQGPKALQLIKSVLGQAAPEKAFNFKQVTWNSAELIVATTGYTGELGAEIFVPWTQTEKLWEALLKSGEAKPIGLGARDTLRLEKKYSLYGHEIDDTTSPDEAGLNWVVKPAAKDFIGKETMLKLKEKGSTRKLIGFRLTEKGVPRQGYQLAGPDKVACGAVTSGTHSPSLDKPIGIGYVATQWAKPGTTLFVDIRGKWVAAEVCETPFI